MSDDALNDLIEFWHLDYEGDLELAEFMAERAGWTIDDVEEWLDLGVRP